MFAFLIWRENPGVQTLTLHGGEESTEATDASAPSAPQEEKAIPEGRFETVRLSRWPDHLSLFEGTFVDVKKLPSLVNHRSHHQLSSSAKRI